MQDLLVAAALFVAAFLLGSVPWGLIISKVFYHTDLREHGSGNIGTTNAIRTMGKVGGYAVFVLDFGKGLLSGVLAWWFSWQFLPGGGLAPDALVAMNQPSLDKFAGAMAEGGVVVADSTLIANVPDIPGVRMCALPATAMAEEAGFKKLANIIMAGKLFAETRFCAEDTLWKAMEKCVPASKAAMLEMNKKALTLGMDA